jgi:hypothetical protein
VLRIFRFFAFKTRETRFSPFILGLDLKLLSVDSHARIGLTKTFVGHHLHVSSK